MLEEFDDDCEMEHFENDLLEWEMQQVWMDMLEEKLDQEILDFEEEDFH